MKSVEVREAPLNASEKISFDEAVRRARNQPASARSQITKLQLHPDGTWTVQWLADYEEK